MLWRRPHEPPGNRSCKPLLNLEPPLGLGVKASLRRFAALTPASLRLEGQCGSRWLPLFDERELPPLRGIEWQRWLAPSSTR